MVGPWIRGRLALAGVDLSTDLRTWLDMVHALLVEMPVEALEKLNKALIVRTAMADPEAARATWGRRPEHRAAAKGLGAAPGLEAGGGQAPAAGTTGR